MTMIPIPIYSKNHREMPFLGKPNRYSTRSWITLIKPKKICNQQQGGTVQPSKSKESYVKAKEQLTNESRQFVTASKLFVKSATESEGQLVECLNHCTVMIDRIGKVTIDVSVHTPTPMQTQSLIGKVRDVADTFFADGTCSWKHYWAGYERSCDECFDEKSNQFGQCA